ncbi:MAG TPA: Fe-S cluster assembly protein HesB [Planctomycetia bacterium]|nr:Fe-S cluster assembly protein HesB [Planctomycetia bacterium]
MPRFAFTVECPPCFAFRTTVFSHGWVDLEPFVWDEGAETLHAAIDLGGKGLAVTVREADGDGARLEVTATTKNWSKSREKQAALAIGRMFGFAIRLDEFFAAAGKEYEWARTIGAGRMLRAATPYEDAVKTLTTTNCSWALTKLMVSRLVEALGEELENGRRAFPTAAAMATRREAFYRDKIKAGYRAPFLVALAKGVARGQTDPAGWESWPEGDPTLGNELRKLAGFGPYAAESMCRLLGRYDGLALDSWCRASFVKRYGEVDRKQLDAAIARRYETHGRFRGLALWLDLTREWHETGNFGDTKFRPVEAPSP